MKKLGPVFVSTLVVLALGACATDGDNSLGVLSLEDSTDEKTDSLFDYEYEAIPNDEQKANQKKMIGVTVAEKKSRSFMEIQAPMVLLPARALETGFKLEVGTKGLEDTFNRVRFVMAHKVDGKWQYYKASGKDDDDRDVAVNVFKKMDFQPGEESDALDVNGVTIPASDLRSRGGEFGVLVIPISTFPGDHIAGAYDYKLTVTCGGEVCFPGDDEVDPGEGVIPGEAGVPYFDRSEAERELDKGMQEFDL